MNSYYKSALLFLLMMVIHAAGYSQSTVIKSSDLLVQGFAKKIHGMDFAYHSAIPNIDAAYLVRAIDGKQVAEWETAAVVSDARKKDVVFVWQAGLGCNIGRVPMHLSINGKETFTFYTGRSHEWDVENNGRMLSFRNVHIDGAGDLFGFFFLRVPSGTLKRGDTLRLKVTGSNSNSQAWYMTFLSEIPNGISFTAYPGVFYEEGKKKQAVNVQLVYFGSPEKGKLIVDGQLERKINLHFGIQNFKISLPATNQAKETKIQLQSKNLNQEEVLTLKPVRKWQVNFVQHSHTDIGYTRPQTEILGEHLRFIDYALDYCDATDSYDDDAKFRWTCEASFAVEDYLKSRPPAQIERLKKRVQEGRIEITGMYFNFDEMPDEQTYVASLQPIKTIQEAGFKVSTAMQDDVNGIGWCFADYLPGLGIKYLNMGTHGHRALIAFDKPTAFWWESPSGNRMLAFRAEHYMTGNTVFGIHSQVFDYFENKLMLYLQNLEELGYPYDIIPIQHSGYLTDNSPPSTLACEMVKIWNEKYEYPKLRNATVSEFFTLIERDHSSDLPVIRGAWPDWWTDGFASGAREGAASRTTHTDIIAYQSALAMAAMLGSSLPVGINERIDEVNQALLFYDEHTFGYSESVRAPFSKGTMEQRAIKESYAWEAFRRSRKIGEEALGLLQEFMIKKEVPTLNVINTLSWARSGLVEVYIDHEILPDGLNIGFVDDSGQIVPAQALKHRSDGTYWGIWVSDIPPMGMKQIQIRELPANQVINESPLPKPTEATTTLLENDFYSVWVDNQKGAITRILDKETNINIVDTLAPYKLGEFILEKLGNRSEMEAYTLKTFKRMPLDSIWFEALENGPVWMTARYKGESETLINPAGFELEIRLFHQTKRIDLVYMVRKRSITDPEGFYLAFPFVMPDGRIYAEVQGGTIQAGVDQVPGSSNDWNTVQNFASVIGKNGQIMISSHEIPLMQFGNINTGRYQAGATPETNHIFGWPMNNYWVTNFNADQRGEFEFTYSISSSNDNSLSVATRFGWGKRVPLLGRVLPAVKGNPTASQTKNELLVSGLITGVPENVLMINMKPGDADREIIMHLREVDGKKTPLKLTSQISKALKISEVSVTGQKLVNGDTEHIDGFASKFLKISW